MDVSQPKVTPSRAPGVRPPGSLPTLLIGRQLSALGPRAGLLRSGTMFVPFSQAGRAGPTLAQPLLLWWDVGSRVILCLGLGAHGG